MRAIRTGRVSPSGADVRTPHVCRDVSVAAPRPRLHLRPKVADWLCPRRPRISWRNSVGEIHVAETVRFSFPNFVSGFRPSIPNAVGVCDAIPQRNCGRFSRPFLFPESEKERQARAPHGPRLRPASSFSVMTHQRIAMHRYESLQSPRRRLRSASSCPRPPPLRPRPPPLKIVPLRPPPPRSRQRRFAHSSPNGLPSSMARWAL